MGILVNKNSRVIIQGFTGKEATFHASQMIKYGTLILGGVTPTKGNQIHLERPVFNTVKEAIKATKANVSIIFVPPAFSSDAIIEASEAKISLIICITEGIPLSDMIKVKRYIKNKNSRLIGPNCPGIITPGETKIGIMPDFIFKKGKVGIVSRSGTLTYEIADQVVKSGYGISTAIGIGGDSIIGTSIKEIVSLFMKDIETKVIIIIGEIGGILESQASRWIYKKGNKKPVIGFIAGKTAPKGRTMGHAGAIVDGKYDTAENKMKVMKDCGLHVIDSPVDIGITLKKILS